MIIRTMDQPTDQTTHNKIKAFLQSKPDFYSNTVIVEGKPQKVFTFPKSFSLGKIAFVQKGIEKRLEARGTQIVPVNSVVLQGYTNLAEFPQLLRYFRQDDLRSILSFSSEGSCETIMAEIARFPRLHGISLAQIDFRNQDLKLLEGMKNLHALSIITERLDLELLSKNKVLPQLENFAVNTHSELTPVLSALSADKLQLLELKNAKLTKADFVKISTFKHLLSLSLVDVLITNADLEQLTSLHNLKILYLTDFKWNADCVEILKKFKNLESLTLPNQFVNDPISKMQIKLALPHLKKLVGHTRIDLD